MLGIFLGGIGLWARTDCPEDRAIRSTSGRATRPRKHVRGSLEFSIPAKDWKAPMPEISRFFGMVIAMYYNDHAPPHFHVRYAGQKAIVGIDGLELLEGKLTPRARALVLEWAAAHQEELRIDWDLAREQAPLNRIDPLE
jgi:hypothetical protein